MKIANLKVGTRLGIGFAIVLALAIVSTAIGIWNMRQVAMATQRMMAAPLAKERTVSDWYFNISAAVIRTSFIIESNDNTLPDKFAADIAAGAKKAAAIQNTFELTSDRERAMYAGIKTYREKFQVAKNAAMKAKQANDPSETARVYQTEFKPVAQGYEAVVLDFLKLQRETIDATAQQIADLYDKSLRLSILLGVLIVALGALCAWMISRSITRPLATAIGVAQTVASGDLTSHIEVNTTDETGQLMQALKDMNGSLLKVVGAVRHGTDAIATASGEIAAGNLDLSARTEQQAASLEETASSIEELTSTVRQNADNAQQANQLAASASEVAVRGGAVVSEVVDTMDAINESSKKIVDIISVIDGIAFQTNILALNAAVEAARAGDQGRGFAVVASEVRSLAQRSAAAAKEIKGLIGDSVNRTDAGVRLVRQAGITMSEVVDSIRNVTTVMNEISTASHEQTIGIEQVNQTISQMDEVTQQNAALVEQAAAAATSLQHQSDNLLGVVSVFRIGAAQEAPGPLRNITVANAPIALPAHGNAAAPLRL
ncbi:methyl-accepting chemotaxis protein [Herbaspirillum sp. RV1423]|uniref:methyl-accepting chemotaxis protein n=1 Tax=Herbaspirillum sp. RV1423 TaxID=1443993 RepID=UPI0004BB63BD|nr:methyl-accepting chemotaxis protein [Herbaspirillum sp. RV1423]